MEVMTEIEYIENVLELLRNFQHTVAYTGELGKIKQKSYVEYGQICLKIGELDKKLRKLKKELVNK